MTEEKKQGMFYARVALLLVWVPVSLFIGLWIMNTYINIGTQWQDFHAAIIFPIVGMFGAWLLAPEPKKKFALGFYIVGLLIAQYFTPSSFPVWHEKAYQSTHIPFLMAAAVGGVCLAAIWLGARHGPNK